jgi:hypothetical protein
MLMNNDALLELAQLVKDAVEAAPTDSPMPEWLAAMRGLPVDGYAQDLCRALRVGLFAHPSRVLPGPAPTVWIEPKRQARPNGVN